MINDLLKLFKKGYDEYGDEIVLKIYKPKNGLYIRINSDGTRDKLVMTRDTDTTDRLYAWFRDRDYYSILADMNKPVDSAKKIHSNNLHTLFMKKDIFPGIGENALTPKEFTERVEAYFSILESPEKKFADSSARELYESTVKPVDKEQIAKNKAYILQNFDKIAEEAAAETFEGYISIFFEADIEDYKTEGERYLRPRIFNKNTYNVKLGEDIMGLSNYNMGSNDKKPYLELKSMVCGVPYRLPVEDALMVKRLFDWLSYQERELYIPHDYDFKSGLRGVGTEKMPAPCYFLRTQKAKEVELWDIEYLPSFSKHIKFHFDNILQFGTKDGGIIADRDLHTLTELEMETDKWFFGGRLTKSYDEVPKVKSGEFSKQLQNLVVISREAFYRFFKKGMKDDLEALIDRLSMEIVKEHLIYGKGLGSMEAAMAFNLRLAWLDYFSIKGGSEMADRIQALWESTLEKISSDELVVCKSDEEFYFAAGQLVYFILSKSKANNKKQNLLEPFLRAKSHGEIKKRLMDIHDKYKHEIGLNDTRFKNAYGMVLGYEPESRLTEYADIFAAGMQVKSMFYQKEEK